jgi:hypothetical protein
MLGCVWRLARLVPSANFAKRRGVRWQRGEAQACPDDTAVERWKDALRPLRTVRHATAVAPRRAGHRTPRRWRGYSSSTS